MELVKCDLKYENPKSFDRVKLQNLDFINEIHYPLIFFSSSFPYLLRSNEILQG